MAETVTIHGLRELKRRLGELPVKVARRIARGALREAGAPIVDAARALVPVETTRLQDAIDVSEVHHFLGDRYMVEIGVLDSKAYYARFVEYGADGAIEITRKGRVPRKKVLADPVTGHVFGRVVTIPPRAPHPFLRPAVDQHWTECVDLLGDLITEELVKEATVR